MKPVLGACRSHLHRALRALHVLRDDQRGNVMIMTAASVLLLIAAGGSAVDFGRQALVHARVQQAIDAAAIAIATLPTTASQADKTATFQRYLSLNYSSPNSPELSYLGVTINASQFTVNYGSPISVTTIPGAIQVPSLFIKLLPGAPASLPVEAKNEINSSTATTPATYDVIFVLDNSGSMASADVGTANSLDSTNVATALANAQAECAPLYTSSWCNSNLATGSGTFVSGVTPYYIGLTGASRLNALRYAASNMATSLFASNPQSRVAIVSWNYHVLGTLPLTGDSGAVQSFLATMYAFDATNSAVAMQQAQTLSGAFDSSHVHAIIYLTDGQNTYYDASSVNTATGECTGSTKLADGTPAPVCQKSNDTTTAICQSFKNSGALVYSIAYGADVNNSTIQNYLSSCASTIAGTVPVAGYTKQTTLANEGTYFFIAPDAATLDTAFNGILTSIRKIKLAK